MGNPIDTYPATAMSGWHLNQIGVMNKPSSGDTYKHEASWAKPKI